MYRKSYFLILGLGVMVFLLSLVPIRVGAAKLSEWTLDYNEGGGGLELKSPSGDFRFRQLGYLQFRAGVLHSDFKGPEQQGDFGVRRARLDWIIDINKKYQLLLEGDMADGGGTNASDFDFVVGRISGPSFWGGTWYVGKFITPFSTENNRSSRSLDMIERYLALNSMFLLPALDVQYGGMIKQPLSQDLTLYTGVFNGNGRAADNLADNNGSKEFQVKLRNDLTENFTWSIAFDRSHEQSQTLSLEGYSFTNYSSVSVQGTRRIYGGSFDYTSNSFSLRGEGLYASFPDANATLQGGYLQPAYFQYGNRNGGLQYLLRLDLATIEDDDNSIPGDTIRAVTFGMNWYINGNLRLKVNAVGEEYSGPRNNVTELSGVQGEGFKPYLLSELQFKF
jgi:phosphate-selective porin